MTKFISIIRKYIDELVEKQRSSILASLLRACTGFFIVAAPDCPKVFHYFQHLNGLSWHYDIVIVDYYTAIGDKTPVAFPLRTPLPPIIHTPPKSISWLGYRKRLKRHNTRLTAFFQDNPAKLVPECLHHGFYWSNQGRWFAFSALTLLVGRQEGHLACKNTGCWFVGGDDLTGALHDL